MAQDVLMLAASVFVHISQSLAGALAYGVYHNGPPFHPLYVSHPHRLVYTGMPLPWYGDQMPRTLGFTLVTGLL